MNKYYSQLTKICHQIDIFEKPKWNCQVDNQLYKNIAETKRVFIFLIGLHQDSDDVRSGILGTKEFELEDLGKLKYFLRMEVGKTQTSMIHTCIDNISCYKLSA